MATAAIPSLGIVDLPAPTKQRRCEGSQGEIDRQRVQALLDLQKLGLVWHADAGRQATTGDAARGRRHARAARGAGWRARRLHRGRGANHLWQCEDETAIRTIRVASLGAGPSISRRSSPQRKSRAAFRRNRGPHRPPIRVAGPPTSPDSSRPFAASDSRLRTGRDALTRPAETLS
jgi:hypothetical protein